MWAEERIWRLLLRVRTPLRSLLLLPGLPVALTRTRRQQCEWRGVTTGACRDAVFYMSESHHLKSLLVKHCTLPVRCCCLCPCYGTHCCCCQGFDWRSAALTGSNVRQVA